MIVLELYTLLLQRHLVIGFGGDHLQMYAQIRSRSSSDGIRMVRIMGKVESMSSPDSQ